MSDAIYTALDTKLTADQSSGSVYALVSGRIHAEQLPNDSDYPAIRYATIADPLAMRLQSDARDTDIQFDVYGDRNKWDDVDAINKALRDLLHRATLSISGFEGGQMRALDYGVRIAEPDVARMMSKYRIWTNT